jgi:hypothetical protein
VGNDVLKIDFTDNDAALKITTGNPGIGVYVENAPNTERGLTPLPSGPCPDCALHV